MASYRLAPGDLPGGDADGICQSPLELTHARRLGDEAAERARLGQDLVVRAGTEEHHRTNLAAIEQALRKPHAAAVGQIDVQNAAVEALRQLLGRAHAARDDGAVPVVRERALHRASQLRVVLD